MFTLHTRRWNPIGGIVTKTYDKVQLYQQLQCNAPSPPPYKAP